MKNFELQWDRDYGLDKRTGWSIVLDGSFYVQLEPSLLKAVWKAWRLWRLVRNDPHSPHYKGVKQ